MREYIRPAPSERESPRYYIMIIIMQGRGEFCGDSIGGPRDLKKSERESERARERGREREREGERGREREK